MFLNYLVFASARKPTVLDSYSRVTVEFPSLDDPGGTVSDHIQVHVRRDVFEKLKSLAEPLVDDTSTVIDRLIRHWEATPPKDSRNPASDEAALWQSSRGDVLPVGAPLQGRYKGKTFAAVVARNGVRFEGKTYSTLSAAAVAAKGLSGVKGDAASTNGRDFWALRDSTGNWFPVSSLRSREPAVDTKKLLAELMHSK